MDEDLSSSCGDVNFERMESTITSKILEVCDGSSTTESSGKTLNNGDCVVSSVNTAADPTDAMMTDVMIPSAHNEPVDINSADVVENGSFESMECNSSEMILLLDLSDDEHCDSTRKTEGIEASKTRKHPENHVTDNNTTSVSPLCPVSTEQNDDIISKTLIQDKNNEQSKVPESPPLLATNGHSEVISTDSSHIEALDVAAGSDSETDNLVIDERTDPDTSMEINPDIANTMSQLEQLLPAVQKPDESNDKARDTSIVPSVIHAKDKPETATDDPEPGPTVVCSKSLKNVVSAMADFGLPLPGQVNDSTQDSYDSTDETPPYSDSGVVDERSSPVMPAIVNNSGKDIAPSTRSVSAEKDSPNLVIHLKRGVTMETCTDSSKDKKTGGPSHVIVIDDESSDSLSARTGGTREQNSLCDYLVSQKNSMVDTTHSRNTKTIATKSTGAHKTVDDVKQIVSVCKQSVNNVTKSQVEKTVSSPVASSQPIKTFVHVSGADTSPPSDTLPKITQIYGGITENNLDALHSHGSVKTIQNVASAAASSPLLTDILKRINKTGLSSVVTSENQTSPERVPGTKLAAASAPRMSSRTPNMCKTIVIAPNSPTKINVGKSKSYVKIIAPKIYDGKSTKTAIDVERFIERPWSPSDEEIIVKKEKSDFGYDQASKHISYKPIVSKPAPKPQMNLSSTGVRVNRPQLTPVSLGSTPNNIIIRHVVDGKYVTAAKTSGSSQSLIAARNNFQSIIRAPQPLPVRPIVVGNSTGQIAQKPLTTSNTTTIIVSPSSFSTNPMNMGSQGQRLQFPVPVPLLISKPNTVQNTPSQGVIFTLAPAVMPGLSTNNTSVPSVVGIQSLPSTVIANMSYMTSPSDASSLKSTTALKTVTMSIDNSKLVPVVVTKSVTANDCVKFLSKIEMIKKNFSIGVSFGIEPKYTCPPPPPSLLLDSQFHKMYVCRGCESMFHKQTTLSNHQLRRTLCARYSCRPSCHVLFYNLCQLKLHMRSHPCSVADWKEKVEISGLPEAILREITDARGKTYDDVKRAVFANKRRLPQSKKPKLDTSAKNARNDTSQKDASQQDASQQDASSEYASREDASSEDGSKDSPLSVSPAPQGDSTRVSSAQTPPPIQPHSSPLVIPGRPAFVVNTFFNDRRVLCTECGMMFQTRAGLASHMNNRGSNKFLYFCKTCPVVLRSQCAQNAHIRIHKNTSPFVCPECGQVIHGTHKVFWKHLHVKCAHHIRQVLYKCTVPSCDKKLKDKSDLLNHTMADHAMKFHKCLACPMAFKTASKFAQHTKEKHQGNNVQKVIHKCPLCDAVYNDDNFKSHIVQHLVDASVEVVFRCNACNVMFNDRRLCLGHMEKMHKFYFNHHEMCHVCGVEFKTTSSLFNHQKQVHPNIVQLDDALTEFLRHNDIIKDTGGMPKLVKRKLTKSPEVAPSPPVEADEVHIKQEPKDDPMGFSCHRCQTKFEDATLYQRHMAKHRFIEKKRLLAKSDDADEPPSKRVNPGKDGDLVLKIKLSKLESMLTGEDEKKEKKKKNKGPVEPAIFTKQLPGAPDPDPEYCCSECGDGFYLEKSLNEHMKSVHSLDRQFPCHLCGKTYTDVSAMRLHVRKRHLGSGKEKPFVCWLCQEKDVERGFFIRTHLIKHITKEHKILQKNIDFSKIPDKKSDMGRTRKRVGSPSSSTADLDQEAPSEHGEEPADADVPAIKRLKLQGESGYSCAKCSFTTVDRPTFLTHITKHQTTKLQGSVQCQECGLVFTVAPSLKRHLFVVHQIRNFSAYLSDSGMDLVSQPKEEDVIMPTHTVNPPLDNILAMKFRGQKPILPKVPPKEELNMDDYGLECKVCYRLYDSVGELRSHMRTHGMAFIRSKRYSETPKEVNRETT